MSPLNLAAFIAMFLPAIACAQTTMYVAYDGALVYADADYLSDIIDTLRIGDSVIVHERNKRFARIRSSDNEAWVLIANISATMPRGARAKAPDRTQIVDTSRAGQSAPATPTSPNDAQSRNAPLRSPQSAPYADAVQCSGMTKAGKQCSRKTKEGSAYCWQHAK